MIVVQQGKGNIDGMCLPGGLPEISTKEDIWDEGFSRI